MKKNNKGFSLIDVVCAAAIIALVALPICSGFLSAAKSNQRIQTKTETYNMLNNELSLILASGEVALDAGVTIQLGAVEYVDGSPVHIKEDSEGNSTNEPLYSEYSKHFSANEILIISLTPKKAIADNTEVAYIEVELTYDDPTTDETENYQVSGVWTE